MVIQDLNDLKIVLNSCKSYLAIMTQMCDKTNCPKLKELVVKEIEDCNNAIRFLEGNPTSYLYQNETKQ